MSAARKPRTPVPHDPRHPYLLYLLRRVGCGHGVLWADHCPDCEIAAAQDRYLRAMREVRAQRARLAELGCPVDGADGAGAAGLPG